ncbi:hypothetical protein [Luteolibacter sp. Populi]|uniref:hypothetical protein n=1 Tax=Luteolibacter sp. Populi TaxID=3230487 RepID=UPI003467180C
MKFRILFACLVPLSVMEADTLRIVELSDLGVGKSEDEPTVSRTPWHEGGNVVFPGIRGAAVLEAYVVGLEQPGQPQVPQGSLRVALRLKDDKPLEGFVDRLPTQYAPTLVPLAFKFDPAKFPAASEEEFAAIRKEHDARLARASVPGAAWYRHRAGVVAGENRPRPEDELDSTFRMASGGRAVAENLALDRELILADGIKGEAVDISTLKGVTVRAIDWTGKIKPGEVKVDPLAMLIPQDQYVLFSPSLGALLELKAVVEKEGAPILQTYDVRSPYRDLVSRYQAQMGIDNLEFIASTLNMGSVAVTGGDPFFATGTDMALVFATDKPDLVLEALATTIGLKAKLRGVEVKEDGGIRSYQTADRSFSAHLAKFEGAVVIANSTASLKRVAAVARKEAPALGALEEFKFFRQRYPLGEEESAYLFLSDATIRRWSGPALRISASRRTRAAAALGELVASKIDGKPAMESFENLLGKTSDAGGTIRSEIYNTLGFLTPASELEVKTVSPAEANAYERWRAGYESGWRKVFDPIALRLRMKGGKRELDLSVIPLTIDSGYRRWIDVTGSKKPEKGAQAAHPEAKAFFSFAVDHESELFRKLGEQSLEMLPGLKANPLGWVGDSVSVFLDDGFFWRALKISDNERLLGMNYLRIPLGVRIASRSSVQLAVFMTALRGIVEESAPNLVEWQQRKHGETTYVAVVSQEEESTPMSAAIYYAALKDALILSLDEKVLQRAVDRAGKKPVNTGEHVRAEADSDASALLGMSGASRLRQQQLESWAALPILNEWHRRDPSKDPGVEYAAAFKEDIRCPGGKGYRWNEAAGTMESVVFGFPAEPRGEEVKFASGPLRFKAGINFEDDGLRLHASMEPVPAPPPAPPEAEIEVPAGFPQLKDLVPTTEGLELTYQVDETDAEGPYKKVLKNLAPVTREDGTLVSVQGTVDAEGEDEDYGYLQEQLLSDKGYAVLRMKRDDVERIYTLPMPLLPGKLAPGVKFGGDHRSDTKSEEGLGKDGGEVRARVVGLETVEVPAGVFENCVRIDGEFDYLAHGEIGRVTDSTWYAPGVGIVKMTWKSEFDHGTEVLEKVVKP